MKNVHVGSFPPPIGGVSIYLYRLSKIDKKASFIDEKSIFGNGTISLKMAKSILGFFFKLFFQLKSKELTNFIIHSQNKIIRSVFLIFSYFRKIKISVFIHGEKSLIGQYNNSNILFKFILKKLLDRAEFIRVVNKEYKLFIKKNMGINHSHIIVKNAFLPPNLEDEIKILKNYDFNLIKFMQTKAPLIVANASFIRFHKQIDLYGFDLTIELSKILKNDFPNFGFIFAISDDSKEREYINNMIAKIKKYEIQNNFYIFSGNQILWPIIKRADLLIRPTNTDGDSISIREAIFFDTPVLASDVVKRQKLCKIFRNRDLDDLYNKCKSILTLNS